MPVIEPMPEALVVAEPSRNQGRDKSKKPPAFIGEKSEIRSAAAD